MLAHTLKIRCPSWDHVENFYLRKVKEGNVLLARVPFTPEVGAAITLSLELPDGVQVDIGAEVSGVRLAPDGRKSAIRLQLHGLDDLLRARLVAMVADYREGAERVGPLSEPPALQPRTRTGVPVPLPSDAPVDEIVVPVTLRSLEEVDDNVRELYAELDEELARLRERAAHDVLGVEPEAEVPEIRSAYFEKAKRYHPDVLARHQSADIVLMASEIFIHVNKAYDRLRDAAVASGTAIVAGPSLLPHKGWIAGFDDIGTARPRVPLRSDDFSGPTRVAEISRSDLRAPEAYEEIQVQFGDSRPTPAASPGGGLRNTELFGDLQKELAEVAAPEQPEQDAHEVMEDARKLLGEANYERAREELASLLSSEPRNRLARSLYHVAYGHTLREKGKKVEAQTQFEVALTHDPACLEAASAITALRPRRTRRPSLIRRLFGRSS